MDLTEQCQGPGILLIFSPCFLLHKKQFSSDFSSQNFALTLCLFITYICSYSLNLVISELYVVDSFLFLIVKERLIFIISLTFLLAYILMNQDYTTIVVVLVIPTIIGTSDKIHHLINFSTTIMRNRSLILISGFLIKGEL